MVVRFTPTNAISVVSLIPAKPAYGEV